MYQKYQKIKSNSSEMKKNLKSKISHISNHISNSCVLYHGISKITSINPATPSYVWNVCRSISQKLDVLFNFSLN